MRFLFLAFLLILPSSAFAQSRVVNDTFADDRESHRQSSAEAFQSYQEDGAVMMKERAAAAEEVDAIREDRRAASIAAPAEWWGTDVPADDNDNPDDYDDLNQ